MTTYMTPFTKTVNLKDGTIPDAVLVQKRYLSDLKGLFSDSTAEAAMLPQNPLIYEVYEATQNPNVSGQLLYSTTVIHPGRVGDEYFFTRGHYHAKADCAELYFGLVGEGCLLLQTPDGQVSAQSITPGAAAYVPPYWGHRTINIGDSNFVFLACYPAEAGYDYKTIAERGFAQILIQQAGQPTLVTNPKWHG